MYNNVYIIAFPEIPDIKKVYLKHITIHETEMQNIKKQNYSGSNSNSNPNSESPSRSSETKTKD